MPPSLTRYKIKKDQRLTKFRGQRNRDKRKEWNNG